MFCFQEIPPPPPSKTRDSKRLFLIQPSLHEAPFGSVHRKILTLTEIGSIEKFEIFQKTETLSLRRHLNMAIKSVDLLFLLRLPTQKALSHLDFVVGKIAALGITNMFQFKRSLKKSTLRQYKSE